ncbi:MAG: SDR family NAD(P)-dependent oxidoreductase [Bacteroidetes bacterium]|nr:SDR family NAD(P)-dependent oxidoreductase [Bacteroidota bacterium]
MTEKVIVIVGMGGGIAFGVARKFGKENFIVAMVGRNGKKLREYKDMLEADGIKSEFYIGNAADEFSLRDALKRIEEELGTPDVLLYNVANIKGVNLLEDTTEGMIHDFKMNVIGAVISAKEVIPGMKKRGSGCILLTGGGFALYPDPNYASLGIGKAGIRNLALSLSKAVEGSGIIVGTVTVCGIVDASNPVHNPANIASKFYDLYVSGKNGAETIL